MWIVLGSCLLIASFLSSTSSVWGAMQDNGRLQFDNLESVSSEEADGLNSEKDSKDAEAVRTVLFKRANMGYRMMCQLHPRNCPGRLERRVESKRANSIYSAISSLKTRPGEDNRKSPDQDFLPNLAALREELDKQDQGREAWSKSQQAWPQSKQAWPKGQEAWLTGEQLRQQIRRQLLAKR